MEMHVAMYLWQSVRTIIRNISPSQTDDHHVPIIHIASSAPSSAMQRTTKRTKPPNLALFHQEHSESSNISLDSDSDEDVDLDADGA